MAKRRSPRLTVNCGSDDFAAVIADWMDEHVYELDEDVAEATGKAGQQAADQLKAKSAKRTGKYAKNWVAEMEASETGVEVTVHNEKTYMLTHLLEKGHVIRNQPGGKSYGRTAGDGVIAEVAESVGADFEGRFQQ